MMAIEFVDRLTGFKMPLAPSVGLDEKEMVKLMLQNLDEDIEKSIEQIRLTLLWILHQMDKKK